jgi:hypothetical protein
MKLRLKACVKVASLSFEELLNYPGFEEPTRFPVDQGSTSEWVRQACEFISNASNPLEQRADLVRNYDDLMEEAVDHVQDDQVLVDNFIKDMADGNINTEGRW